MLLMIIKHFVCDFLFQTNWIAKKNVNSKAMSIHCLINAVGMFFVVLIITQSFISSFVVFVLEYFIHLFIDINKSQLSKIYKTQRMSFLLLGIDQFLHYIWYYYVYISLGGV